MIAKQCPYCIEVRRGQRRLSQHVLAAHPDKVEDWVTNERWRE